MDYDIFDKLVSRVYHEEEDPWTLEEYIWVFHKFFDTYRKTFSELHPHISQRQIRAIMDKMPYLTCESRYNTEEDLAPEDYGPMIDRYFDMDWENCDYRINHFFSGQIREMRFYEVLY